MALAACLAAVFALGVFAACDDDSSSSTQGSSGTQQGSSNTQQGGSGAQQGSSGTQQGGGQSSEHTHSFSNEWKKDDEFHWHAATCEHTDEISGKEAHTMSGGACSVCGYFVVDENTDIEAYRSDTVTQEEWEAALSSQQLENFLMIHKYQTMSGEEYESSYQIVGKNYHRVTKILSGSRTNYEEEILIKRTDTGYDQYTISYTDPANKGKWKKTSPVIGSSEKNNNAGFGDTLRSVKDSYGNAIFDNETTAYRCTALVGFGTQINFYLKFNAGKVFALGYEVDPNSKIFTSVSNVTFMTVYGYGEAAVKAPRSTDVQI